MVRTYGMTVEVQEQVWTDWRAGRSLRAIGRDQGVPMQHVRRFLAQHGGVRPIAPRRSTRHLSAQEREEISRGLARGDSLRVIAASLDRAHSSVVREVARNGGRDRYRAQEADAAAWARSRRPKVSKLAADPVLRSQVQQGLAQDWSPEQISQWLRREFPSDPSMRVSHETIYLSLFQPARRALPTQLRRHLRSGRTMRHPRLVKPPSGRGRIRDMVPITARPAEVESRTTVGHWEGDLIMGRRPSAVAVLVERRTRLLRLVALSAGIKAPAVRDALIADLAQVPDPRLQSLTWDRGREMADHAAITRALDCPVFFCAPGSPWQRGTVENTNRLLRQYLAKSDDLNRYSQHELNAIAEKLNTRPRQVLSWATPTQAWTASTPPATMEPVH